MLHPPQAILSRIPVIIRFATILLALSVIAGPPAPAQAQPVGIVDNQDYDADDDGLIEVSSLAQLNAIRWDLDGDGLVDDGSHSDDYDAAFPAALTGMGCPSAGCDGYELTADLDFDTNGSGDADAGDTYWNAGQGWTPIGFGAGIRRTPPIPPFEAVFDGNGHTISNLRISLHSIITFDTISHGFVGLFSYAGTDAVVRNLGLESVDVSPSGPGVTGLGGLMGTNGGTISNCYVTGRVSFFDTNDVGGLVGSNSGRIIASYATASVTGGAHTGGLVGWNHAGIYASYATGNVSGRGKVGGLVGNQSDGSATLLYGGGTRGEIVASYATGDVSGYNQIGGLAGNAAGLITASYSLGSVSTGSEPFEGFYDYLRESGNFQIGGLVSNCVYSCPSSDDDSYWDTQTSGQASSPHGTGKTSSDLKQPTGYTGIYADWNVDVDGDGSPDDPWDFGTGDQYPVLKYGGLRAANQRGGKDRASGTNGPDNLEGGDGNDLLIGKKGNDVLRGGRGKDELRGGKGDDDLHGGRGADTLFGGQGDDELDGGRGADRLLGGDGDDTYTGGPGADRFVFVAGETGEKIITDFGDGDDVIVLRGADWPALADIVASGVEQDGGYTVYTLADGLTVETDTLLWAEDFVVR